MQSNHEDRLKLQVCPLKETDHVIYVFFMTTMRHHRQDGEDLLVDTRYFYKKNFFLYESYDDKC